MKILDRISSAVNSSNLKSEPGTTWADADVLGASGLAARCNPLGGALVRLFADGKPESAITVLTQMAFKRARTMRVEITDTGCADLAKAVLGWHRYGAARMCMPWPSSPLRPSLRPRMLSWRHGACSRAGYRWRSGRRLHQPTAAFCGPR